MPSKPFVNGPGFVLASKSPRRRRLLESVGLHFRILGSDIDEAPMPFEQPVAYALRVATEKARACAEQGPILAADTVVALNSEVLGKAGDQAAARGMLRQLSGRSHTVHTAVVVRRDPEIFADVVSSTVRFRVLSDEEIASYVATGEPMDKAGAYGIQGRGGSLVASLEGSYTNVVGLPLEETLRLLKMANVR